MPSSLYPSWRMTVNGVAQTLPRWGFHFTHLQYYDRHGNSELGWVIEGGPIPTRPDPYLGTIFLEYDTGTGWVPVFRGRCERAPWGWTSVGWGRTYTAQGLSFCADHEPITNTNRGDDRFQFNLSPEDFVEYRADLAGRTIGEMLEIVLDDPTLSAALAAQGITSYNATDLAAIAHIPPNPCTIQGERAFTALTGFLQAYAPNHVPWPNPDDGELRFLDLREYGSGSGFYPATIELELGNSTDRVDTEGVHLDVSTEGCYTRVLVRGADYAEMKPYKLTDTSLIEDFAWGDLDNTEAKAAWSLLDWNGSNAEARDSGTVSCTDTLNVEVTSDDEDKTWTTDFWDHTETGRKGWIFLTYESGSGVTFKAARRIASCDALTAAGTATITLDRAIPHLNYNKYEIRGQGTGAALVYRKYLVSDEDSRVRLRARSTYPAPITNANGNVAAETSTLVVEVYWSNDGEKPWQNVTAMATVDYSTGNVILGQPSVRYYGTDANLEAGGDEVDGVPLEIIAWIPTTTDALRAVCPPNTGSPAEADYDGTAYDIEGIERTLTLTASFWRDPANQANMDAYACYWLDSVKDTVIEGVIPLNRFDERFATPGNAVQLHATDFTTGWESTTLPVVGARLTFMNGQNGLLYRTELQVSTKRATLSGDQFDRPIREGNFGGLEGTLDAGWLAGFSGSSGGYFGGSTPNMVTPYAIAPSVGTPSENAPGSRAPQLDMSNPNEPVINPTGIDF